MAFLQVVLKKSHEHLCSLTSTTRFEQKSKTISQGYLWLLIMKRMSDFTITNCLNLLLNLFKSCTYYTKNAA